MFYSCQTNFWKLVKLNKIKLIRQSLLKRISPQYNKFYQLQKCSLQIIAIQFCYMFSRIFLYKKKLGK